MRPQFTVGRDASRELGEAALWYEDRSAGLGHDFLRAVDASFAQIQRTPHVFPVVHGSIRRALLRRFPYAVYFVESDDSIRVIACLHVRRDPRSWQQRGDR